MSINNIKSNLCNNDVNYSCICNGYMQNKFKVIILYPCSHMLHTICYKNENKNCPFCNSNIEKVIHGDNIDKLNSNDDKIKQMIINLESLHLDSTKSFIHYHRLPINIIKFTSFLNRVLLIKNATDLSICCELLLSIINMKINIIDNTRNNPIIYTSIDNDNYGKYITWKNQDDKNKKIILIANHSCLIDSVVVYYLFRAGFVAGDYFNKLSLIRVVAKYCNPLIFKRGFDTNIVNKTKEYLEKYKNIIIFPEGGIGNNNSIRQFRTGAFYADAHICPVVIKYNPYVWDYDYNTFILKLITQKEIVVDVHIGDLYVPPFTTEQIQQIRKDMIITGNMTDSNVSNRSFKD